jgi:hypothetical protein
MGLNGDLKYILLCKRGWFDEETGNPCTDLTLAHWLIHDQKKHHEFLTNEINCGLVKPEHHERTNAQENREQFYEKQCKKYGKAFVHKYFTEAFELGIYIEDWLLNG